VQNRCLSAAKVCTGDRTASHALHAYVFLPFPGAVPVATGCDRSAHRRSIRRGQEARPNAAYLRQRVLALAGASNDLRWLV
jgi:hypothetical protein